MKLKSSKLKNIVILVLVYLRNIASTWVIYPAQLGFCTGSRLQWSTWQEASCTQAFGCSSDHPDRSCCVLRSGTRGGNGRSEGEMIVGCCSRCDPHTYTREATTCPAYAPLVRCHHVPCIRSSCPLPQRVPHTHTREAKERNKHAAAVAMVQGTANC